MKHKWLPIALRACAGVAVVGLMVAMLMKASNTAELDSVQQEEKTPISFTQQVGTVNELEKVAENDAYILYANLCDPAIRLERKADGAVMDSRPQNMEAFPDLKKAVQQELSSLLNIRYADRDSNITEVNCMAGSVNRKNFAAKTITDGVRFDFYFANEGFLVPLELTLSRQGLQASVPLADIQEETASVKLTEILPLPNFGAAAVNTDGYAVVPDGSGAIIPFAYDLPGYAQRIYGEDAAVGKTTGSAPTQIARLPIFGISDTKTAVLGIVTAGDARARVAMDTPTDRSPYATVGTEFIYRERLLVNISQQTFESAQANMFEPDHCALERFTVEYRMPANADYVGMANTYRQYLMEEKGMTATADSAALQLQVLGGVMHEENILGIPVNRVLPVTTYADTLELIAALKERGVNALSVDYLQWYKDGTESRLTVDMKAEPRLGGTAGLKKLLNSLGDDTSLYFNLNFTDLMQNQRGFSTLYSTAQNVKKEPLLRQNFFLSTGREKTDGDKVFLLNPAKLSDLISRWSKAMAKWPANDKTGLALDSMGEEIYSHFGEQPLDRGSAQALWEQTIDTVAQQSKNGLLVTDANAYALPYAATVQNAPVEHSRYRCEARSVPFYTIALHGLVDMSVPSVNDGGDIRVLQAVENGIALTYTLGWRNTDRLKNTAGEQYNYIHAADWLDAAAQQHTAITPYLATVSNKAVTAHTQLTEGVYRTEFEGGAWAIVNYTDTAYTADGITVSPNGYLTGGY